MYQKGAERVEGKAELTAGRPVRQRGEKHMQKTHRQTLVYCDSINIVKQCCQTRASVFCCFFPHLLVLTLH